LTWKSYASDGGGAVAWGTRTASPAVLKTQKASRPTCARRRRPPRRAAPLRSAPRRADPPLRANAAYDDDDYAGEVSGDVPRRPGPPVATVNVFAAEKSTPPPTLDFRRRCAAEALPLGNPRFPLAALRAANSPPLGRINSKIAPYGL